MDRISGKKYGKPRLVKERKDTASAAKEEAQVHFKLPARDLNEFYLLLFDK